MKPGLKRIEATLHDLKTRHDDANTETSDQTKRSFSFRVSIGNHESTEHDPDTGATHNTKLDPDPSHGSPEAVFPHHDSVRVFSAQETGEKNTNSA